MYNNCCCYSSLSSTNNHETAAVVILPQPLDIGNGFCVALFICLIYNVSIINTCYFSVPFRTPFLVIRSAPAIAVGQHSLLFFHSSFLMISGSFALSLPYSVYLNMRYYTKTALVHAFVFSVRFFFSKKKKPTEMLIIQISVFEKQILCSSTEHITNNKSKGMKTNDDDGDFCIRFPHRA